MRWRGVRFSVRAMMVVVAVVAAVLGYLHHKRSASFRLRAAANARKAGEYAALAKASRAAWEARDRYLGYGAAYLARRNRMSEAQAESQERNLDFFKRSLDRNEALSAHYKGLEEKYRRAAAYPWLPVAPDPPPPPTFPCASPRGCRAAPAAADHSPEPESPPPIALIASLPRAVFEFGEHPILGRSVPLTIVFRNRSDRPVTIGPIGLAVVTGEDGHEAELTPQGRVVPRRLAAERDAPQALGDRHRTRRVVPRRGAGPDRAVPAPARPLCGARLLRRSRTAGRVGPGPLRGQAKKEGP